MTATGGILDNLLAAVVVWTVVILAGVPLAMLLPAPLNRRQTLLACPILGSAYWVVCLYAFGFSGGLEVALVAAFIFCFASVVYRIRREGGRRIKRPRPGVVAILFAGCAAYMIPLLTMSVPLGENSSERIKLVRGMGLNSALVVTEQIPGEPVVSTVENKGFNAIAAMPVIFSLPAASGILAAEHLAFSCIVLALFFLVRQSCRAMPAAFFSVAFAWLNYCQAFARTGQGQFALVVAIGIFSARIIIDYTRHNRLVSTIPVGICIASMAMTDFIAMQTWMFIAIPGVFIAPILITKHRIQSFAALLPLGTMALVFATPYFLAIRAVMLSGGSNLFASMSGISTDEPFRIGATVLFMIILISFATLVRKGRWNTIGILALPVIAWLIEFLAYRLRMRFAIAIPREIVLFWLAPLAAIAAAAAWRSLRMKTRNSFFVKMVFLTLLIFSAIQHIRLFQNSF